MIRFRMLGGLELHDPQGRDIPTVLRRPKLLALLAYLAGARPAGFHRRDTLVALLWPDLDHTHARSALRQAIHLLREAIGADAFVTRGEEEIGINAPRLASDARDFGTAVERGEVERALELYRGDLLSGVYVTGAPEFERWLEAERAYLRAQAVRAAQALMDREEALGNPAGAARWGLRVAELTPDDEPAVRRVMRLLDRAGDRAGAARVFAEFQRRLARDLDLAPTPETRGLIDQIRRREGLPAQGHGAAPAIATRPLPARPRRGPPRTAALTLAAAALGLLVQGDGLRTGKSAVHAHDLRALELYQEGRDLLTRYTEVSIRGGIYRFNEAIARDSTWAPPHVGLARAYAMLGDAHGSVDPREAFPLMRRAAARALALDPQLTEARVLLGQYELRYGWDWVAAERLLRDAVDGAPHDARALQTLGFCLTLLGRYDDVPALDARAIASSPRDPVVWADAGSHSIFAGRFNDALQYLQRGMEIAPDFHVFWLITGILHAELGDYDQAVRLLERADSASGHQTVFRGRLGYAYALSGDVGAARHILQALKREAAASGRPAKTATAIAVVHIGLGERDSAFAWLEVAYEHRSANLLRVLRTPAGWRLAGDRRYEALLARLGLDVGVVVPQATAHRRDARWNRMYGNGH